MLLALAPCVLAGLAPRPFPSVSARKEGSAVVAGSRLGALAEGRPTAPGQAPDPGTLNYVAHWRLLPAGHATLGWSRLGSETQITFSAQANSIISLIYPVDDHMQSLYDPAHACTTAANNDTHEGRRQRQTQIRYDAAARQLTLRETDRAHDPPLTKQEVKPIPGCVLDILGALDYVRAQPLRVGDVFTFPVNEGGATATVKVTVDLKETIHTPAGSFTSVRTQPTITGGPVLQHEGKLWIWFSDDARHLPVQIQAKVAWGTILAQLSN